MGETHQVFLIAQRNLNLKDETLPRHYAFISFYIRRQRGVSPLSATSRLIKLLRQPHNALILREELKLLENKKQGAGKFLSFISPMYSKFLLMSTFVADLDVEVFTPSNAFAVGEAFNLETPQNNDEGITVIDVTNPEDPHYGFVQFNSRRVLSANGYARGYYPLSSPPASYARDADRPQTPPKGHVKTIISPEFNREIENLISQFQDVKLIEYSVLAEIWPGKFEVEKNSTIPSSNKFNEQVSSLVPSLVQLSLKPALVDVVENDQLDAMDHFFSDPEIRNGLKQMIMEDPDLQSVSVPSFSEIVAKELECDSTITIDLSNCKLTSDQIMGILMPHRMKISSLNLSHNSNVTAQTLETLLTEFGNLRLLILFGTGITLDDLVELLTHKPYLFYKLSALIHPALLHEKNEAVIWASDFGHWCCHMETRDSFYSTSMTLPFFSPTRIVHTIISLFAANRSPGGWRKYLDSRFFFHETYGVDYKEDDTRSLSDPFVPFCTAVFWISSFLRLRGWVFIWYKSSNFGEQKDINRFANNKYAWVRFNSKAVNDCEEIRGIQDPVKKGWVAVQTLGERLFEVYNLEGFLDACVAEGRPPIPEDLRKTALDRLEEWKTVDPKVKFGEFERAQTFQPIISVTEVVELYKEELNQPHYRPFIQGP